MRGVSKELFIGQVIRWTNRIDPVKESLEDILRPATAMVAIVSYHYKGNSVISKPASWWFTPGSQDV
jgi:hypothetical protein